MKERSDSKHDKPIRTVHNSLHSVACFVWIWKFFVYDCVYVMRCSFCVYIFPELIYQSEAKPFARQTSISLLRSQQLSIPTIYLSICISYVCASECVCQKTWRTKKKKKRRKRNQNRIVTLKETRVQYIFELCENGKANTSDIQM